LLLAFPPAGCLPSTISATDLWSALFEASQVLRSRPTPHLSRYGFASSASRRGPHPPQRSWAWRGLPGSDAFPSYVMWPLTPAGRRVLAWRPRTYCLRRIRAPRRLRHLDFRGSIPHPTRLLCTLRRGRHLPRRNTRYRAGATPYPGRTPTGWNTPAFLAHRILNLPLSSSLARRVAYRDFGERVHRLASRLAERSPLQRRGNIG